MNLVAGALLIADMDPTLDIGSDCSRLCSATQMPLIRSRFVTALRSGTIFSSPSLCPGAYFQRPASCIDVEATSCKYVLVRSRCMTA